MYIGRDIYICRYHNDNSNKSNYNDDDGDSDNYDNNGNMVRAMSLKSEIREKSYFLPYS